MRVLLPPVAHRVSRVAPVLRQDVVAHCPRRERHVHERELRPEEVRPLHLLTQLPQRVIILLERLLLLLRLLCLHEAEERGRDHLRDVVDPNADTRAVEGVLGEDVRGVRRECVFEDLAEDEGLVQRFALVLDRRDEAFRVDVCSLGVGGDQVTRWP